MRPHLRVCNCPRSVAATNGTECVACLDGSIESTRDLGFRLNFQRREEVGGRSDRVPFSNSTKKNLVATQERQEELARSNEIWARPQVHHTSISVPLLNRASVPTQCEACGTELAAQDIPRPWPICQNGEPGSGKRYHSLGNWHHSRAPESLVKAVKIRPRTHGAAPFSDLKLPSPTRSFPETAR